MSLKKSSQIEKQRFGCLRCGYVWFTRLKPRYCANCKSSLWNKPRKYFSPETGIEPTEKRTAATGRAAARQRPERIRAEKRGKLETELKTAKLASDNARRIYQESLAPENYNKFDRYGVAYDLNESRKRLNQAREALAEFERETKQNPAKRCADCNTTDNVFKSSLGFNLCPTCETERQETIFQI
jgi:predicted Zn-ribbon and HTH transcriptional regulator